MKQLIDPLNVSYRQPLNDENSLTFVCDNENINKWFSNKAQSEHGMFNCRVTHVTIQGDPELAGFFSLALKMEPQRDFAGYSFVRDTIFLEDKITTVHLKWLAVRNNLQRRGLGTLMMARVVEDAYQIVMKAGAHAMTLQYMGTASKRLYEKFNFIPYGNPQDNGLYLPAAAIVDTIESD